MAQIRTFRPGDLDGMWAVESASAAGEAGLWKASRAALEAYWRLGSAQQHDHLWVVEEGEQVLAYGGLRAWHSPGWQQAEVVVHPAQRGRGLGQALLRQLISAARQRGVIYLCAIAADSPPEGGAFLERQGFQPFVRRLHMRLQPPWALAAPDVPGFTVRVAGPHDYAALAQVNNAAYGTGERVGHANAAGYQRFIEESGAEVRVAEEMPAGPVVGLCEVRRTEAALSDGPVATGHIGSLAVAPAYQGRGLGRRLLACGIDLCRERGWPTVELNVDRDNWPALHLYESAGFRPVYAYTVYRQVLASRWPSPEA